MRKLLVFIILGLCLNTSDSGNKFSMSQLVSAIPTRRLEIVEEREIVLLRRSLSILVI